eukprot:TRINITY_DN6160_c0_g1_i1.p1 TRINITY_DN6160_c0_g1~~TRINITY_DN6160_c0_g1_i1.p1  ORF type:complete len:396 (+),score=107.06 TRINITY_DN6160_c0_g1_i1:67-1188(+)
MASASGLSAAEGSCHPVAATAAPPSLNAKSLRDYASGTTATCLPLAVLTPSARRGLTQPTLAAVRARARRRGDYGDYVRHRMRRPPRRSPALQGHAGPEPDAGADDSAEEVVRRMDNCSASRGGGYTSPYASPRRRGPQTLDWSFCGLHSASGVLARASGSARQPAPEDRARAPSPEEEAAVRGQEGWEESPARPNEAPPSSRPSPEPAASGRAAVPAGVSVRLAHNRFETCEGLTRVLHDSVSAYLVSLDLSCNKLRALPADFCFGTRVRQPRRPRPSAEPLLPFLRALYLHSNELSDEGEVAKLAPLSALRILTLHGNPGLRAPQYRPQCVAVFPELRSLDFSAVTRLDRELAPWHRAASQSPRKHARSPL